MGIHDLAGHLSYISMRTITFRAPSACADLDVRFASELLVCSDLALV